jgi:hypothetical protein
MFFSPLTIITGLKRKKGEDAKKERDPSLSNLLSFI